MTKIKTVFILFCILILFSGCQTIKKKSDEVAEREQKRIQEKSNDDEGDDDDDNKWPWPLSYFFNSNTSTSSYEKKSWTINTIIIVVVGGTILFLVILLFIYIINLILPSYNIELTNKLIKAEENINNLRNTVESLLLAMNQLLNSFE